MKWVLPLLTLSIAAFALAVFAVPVHVRLQLTSNRRQTLAQVSLGIICGLIWFTVYRTHDTTRLNQDGLGDEITSAFEELIRHPENAWDLFSQSVCRKARNKPHQDLREDKNEKPGTPRERFIQPIIRQIFKRGLDVIRLQVFLHFGAGDAATTGMTVGLIHALVGTAMAVFSERLRFLNGLPEITIVPCYNEVRVDIDFDSIVLLRPKDIVLQAIFGQD